MRRICSYSIDSQIKIVGKWIQFFKLTVIAFSGFIYNPNRDWIFVWKCFFSSIQFYCNLTSCTRIGSFLYGFIGSPFYDRSIIPDYRNRYKNLFHLWNCSRAKDWRDRPPSYWTGWQHHSIKYHNMLISLHEELFRCLYFPPRKGKWDKKWTKG